MAIRFIQTDYFKSPFIRGLKAPLKLLYTFIICDCSGAGIWVKDLEAVSMYVGSKISESDFIELANKCQSIDLNNGKFFFPDFIKHQYPKGLQENNPAHKNFILELKKYELLDENLRPFKDPSKELQSSLSNSNSNSNGNGNGNEKPKIEIPIESEFLTYCQDLLKDKYLSLEFSLKQKYAAWVANGWKDGNDKKIKNWKTKIGNTIPFLKPEINSNNKQDDRNKRTSELQQLNSAAKQIANNTINNL